MMPATFSQRLSRPSRQARQWPQVRAPYITTGSPASKRDHALADRRDLARRLDADDLGHLALGESHAAKAPDVEMVEAERLHPHLHLAFRRRRRRIDLGQAKVAVAEELKGAHDRDFRMKRRCSRTVGAA